MESDKKKEKAEADESGYSENQSNFDAEVQAGEWQQIRKFPVYKNRSRQGKIIAMHKAVSNRLSQLTKLYYDLVSKDQAGGEKLLVELRKLRAMQDVLLQCLVWEPKGELRKELVPDEIWELIQ
jgi:hypothetical protein